MSRTTYTNNTDSGHYIGNVFVPPGGTRTVDARLLMPVDVAPADEQDPIEVLAEGTAKEIIEALPGLDAAQLDALAALERAGKDRKTVVEAIELRKLELMDEAGQNDGSAE